MTKIFVTGAAGFLGSHLVDSLVSGGDEVIGLDNLRRGSLDYVREHLASGALTLIQDDIRNYVVLRQALEGVDLVFHLAAQSNVMGASSDPDYSFTTNVVGTYNVLKASAEAGVNRFIFSSSREVYGEPKRIPVTETDKAEPKNMYGASKLAGESYCRAFDGTTELRCTVLRFGNLYGSRDRERVIPIWLERAAVGAPLTLYGGKQVLDFIHVSYAVSALLAASRFEGFGPINVATGKGTSLHELARRLLEASGSTSELFIEPPRAIEVTRFVADVTRMKNDLGIMPPNDPLNRLEEMIH